jgi:hypothetical protein
MRFHPQPSHLLALAEGSGAPARELVRVALLLDGFRSRPDLESRFEAPAGCGLIVMERAAIAGPEVLES